ncbi:MAG: hypothetical protein LC795_13075 [Acidobacteria bacterium]|nr:hypothetical protein [Acidobacteriota bacterium]
MKWARRFRRAGRGEDYAGERVSRLGLVVLACVVFAIGFVYAYPRLKGPPLIRRDFVGKVVDKHLTLRESEIGTAGALWLLVEDGGGRRFRVAVNGEQYERARVGMWARRSGGVVELSRDEPAPHGLKRTGGPDR